MSISASSSATTRKTCVLLVLEEEVLGVAAGDLAAQRPALLDGEERRMLDGRGRDAEPVEAGEEIGAAGGHGRVSRSEDAGRGFSGSRRPADNSRRRPAAPAVAIAGALRSYTRRAPDHPAGRFGCGCSSGVEHNLAKVGVEGSNPFARSKSPRNSAGRFNTDVSVVLSSTWGSVEAKFPASRDAPFSVAELHLITRFPDNALFRRIRPRLPALFPGPLYQAA